MSEHNGRQWEWTLMRVESLGDILAETRRVNRGGGYEIKRPLQVDVYENKEEPGKINLRAVRTPTLDLLSIVAETWEIPAERIIFIGKASRKGADMAENEWKPKPTLVSAKPGDIAKVEGSLKQFRDGKRLP